MKYDVLLRLFDKYPKSRLGKLKILIDVPLSKKSVKDKEYRIY